MPIQYGRNPKSYPPNKAYLDNWERMFGKEGKPEPVASAQRVLDHLTKGARERYCDGDKGKKQ